MFEKKTAKKSIPRACTSATPKLRSLKSLAKVAQKLKIKTIMALYGDLVQALYGDLVQPAIFFNYFLYHVQFYGLSIYRGYIWYNCAHSTTITMLKIRSDLHPRTIPHTSPVRASYGVSFVSWVILRKMTAIYRERTVCPKTSDRVSVMFLTDTPHAPQKSHIQMLMWNNCSLHH